MDEKRAREILGTDIRDDNSLYCGLRYLFWNGEQITLDADFTVDELEAIVWWVKNKTVVKEVACLSGEDGGL